jgi:Protein of unknown function (DUF2924)
MSDTVLAQIAALKTKSTPELREMWRELFGREAPVLGRRYLEDRIAFRLQELRQGGIFVLHDGMGLVAKRLDHIPNTDPPRVRIISDNPLYSPYEGTAEEVNIIGRIRWFAREI